MTLLKSLKTPRTLLLICSAVIVGAIIFITVMRFVMPRSDTEVKTIGSSSSQTKGSGLPVKLEIPKISVSAKIDHVGLTKDGDMDVPSGYDTAGWYKDGPRPGDPGSAVVDGHFGRADGKSAIFDNLHTLQKGDKLSVTDKKGVATTFVVTGARSYAPGEDATAVFRSDDGTARLNLITCQGSWDSSQDGYKARLVVFAEKQDSVR